MKDEIIVYIRSLGCAKNLVDTEVMCGTLSVDGCYLTDDDTQANVFLVNTCGFIRDAKQESYQVIQEALKWKRSRAGRTVAVAGCLVHRELENLKAKYPAVDLFMSLDDVPRIAELVREARKSGASVITPEIKLPTYLYDENTPRLLLTPPAYAYVKVAEGCDHRCAYCAIPMIRGNQRSRSIESIETEVKQLIKGGTREIDFIAQDTSRYGTDLKPAQTLEALLRKCDDFDGEYWLRVLYTHPLHLTDGLVDVLAHSKHVVPYLDIPLQHISSHILQSMKRGMDGAKTKELLQKIRELRPDMTIRTTFLVGFPGETEDDFQELLAFVKEFKFDRLGVFAFSPEEGTPAAEMTEVVPHSVAQKRLDAIMRAQMDISLAKNRSFIGKTMNVLMDELVEEGRRGQADTWQARTAGDAPEVDQIVSVRTKHKHEGPCFANVKITAASAYDLIATEI